MDIKNVSTFITLDPSKLFSAESFLNRAMGMYDGDIELVEEFLKEHLASDSLAYAMYLLEGTKTSSYMGIKIHYDDITGTFSAPSISVYDAKTKKEVTEKISKKRKSSKNLKKEEVQVEAKVDTGSAEAKASARNKRNTPAGKDYKFDTSVFITRKPGESLDSARTRMRQKQHAAKRGVKEEVVGEGKLTSVKATTYGMPAKERQALIDKERERQGVKSKPTKEEVEFVGLTEDFVNDSIDIAVDYFYEQGINEDGLDLIIEEVGLDDFVDFVLDPSEELMEERAARRANVSAPKYADVKAKVDAADKAKKAAKKGEYAKSYAKRSGETEDSTVYDKKKPAKAKPAKAPVKTVTVKKASPAKKAETKKKVAAVTKTVKPKQSSTKPSKEGIGSKIRSAVSKGVERHKKAVGDAKKAYSTARSKGKVPEKRAKEFGKGVVSGVKDTIKFAKKAKKAVVGEEVLNEEEYDRIKDRRLEKYGTGHDGSDRKSKSNYGKPQTDAEKKKSRENSKKAFDNVVSSLKKKYGANAVLTKEEDQYTVTNADKKGNTEAWKRYKSGAKNVKTGKPLYKAADHVKEESSLDNDFAVVVDENVKEKAEGLDLKGKKKSLGKDNVVINPEVKTKVDESMKTDKENLQEVDVNTRSVDYSQEIENAKPIKKKKPLKDFKKLAGAAAKKASE